MILSEQTFMDLAGKQAILDGKIKQAKGITDLPIERIEVAYRIEVAECVNEMKGDVKYWSGKPMNREAFIEEFVDALHFFLSYLNHLTDIENEDPLIVYYVQLINELDYYEATTKMNWDKWELAEYALKLQIIESFGALLYLVEQYGFTEQDVIDTYNRKNEINHARSDSGVY